jgi:hypothetical protein
MTELHLFFTLALNGVERSELHTSYFNFQGNIPQCSPNKRMGGPHSQPVYFEEEKCLLQQLGIKRWFYGCGHFVHYEDPSTIFSKTETSSVSLLQISSFCSGLVSTLCSKLKFPYIKTCQRRRHMKLNNIGPSLICGKRNNVQTTQQSRPKLVQLPRNVTFWNTC